MKSRRVRTMEEFASQSGISRPTLSKYFQDPGSVRATTRARIEAALEELDYRPNVYAMNQNRRLTKNIGVMVPLLSDPFFSKIARSVERLCVAAGFRPILLSSNGESVQEQDNLQTLLSLKPAGALLAPLGRGSDVASVKAFAAEVPTVLFDSNLEGIGAAFIGSDNVSFVEETVEHLCMTGPPPCFFEMTDAPNPNAGKRRRAYAAAMEWRGLEPSYIRVEGTGWDFERIGYDGAMAAIRDNALPTRSVLCSNDRLAIGFLAAAYASGLRVGPGRGCALRVASMDDHPVAQFTCPALTTAAHNYEAVASQSVETLMSLIESDGAHRTRTETLIPASLVVRDSA
ncbi:LacI family DNA-binding transcriptional regulator [Jannaschia seohaensis]|uniref:DNA-binding LacI/PurR family transcriptional regulator n=1 Tax=Jannaschia seohaensis TaxID=475081 RepID=A0A2Y9BWA3_9RHOB|nr:LacI family DNA-binding transcriptional regulator [Jannaschia seohaensis]PWJ22454.1 DNA-binding LacI/PurR family transcriptional regulator [Jannaschia seohaensis]SSA38732.1 DNA-binding transcriptional regulator, LacI/PurR family [Jannaschia seohaensis]